MKLYGYSMPATDELKLLNAKDKDMQRMVANQGGVARSNRAASDNR